MENECCAGCNGSCWIIVKDARKQNMVIACAACNPKGDRPVGVQLLDDGERVTLKNFHKTIAEQQDYVELVFQEFREVAQKPKIYIEGTDLKRKNRDPESASDFVEYFKSRLCVQTL